MQGILATLRRVPVAGEEGTRRGTQGSILARGGLGTDTPSSMLIVHREHTCVVDAVLVHTRICLAAGRPVSHHRHGPLRSRSSQHFHRQFGRRLWWLAAPRPRAGRGPPASGQHGKCPEATHRSRDHTSQSCSGRIVSLQPVSSGEEHPNTVSSPRLELIKRAAHHTWMLSVSLAIAASAIALMSAADVIFSVNRPGEPPDIERYDD